MKLYRITCRGMHGGLGATPHGIAYVVAADAESAYRAVRESLDKRNLGFTSDRSLQSIELMAEQGDYPSCGHSLYIKEADLA